MSVSTQQHQRLRGAIATPMLAACLILAQLFCTAHAQGWRRARTTWYDDHPWMSVHDGSCMYGYLGDRFGGKSNWMVGAINDGATAYSGSCGRCFEMKCVPGRFSDALGNWIDRSNDCRNQDSVIIAITDTCPCYKPENAYSNKRWCCGDMEHFDIGIWAFQKMADPGKGVIMIDYRPVPCPSNYNNALNPSVQKPSSLRTQYPWDKSHIHGQGGNNNNNINNNNRGNNNNNNSQQKVTAFSGPPDSPSGSPAPPSPTNRG